MLLYYYGMRGGRKEAFLVLVFFTQSTHHHHLFLFLSSCISSHIIHSSAVHSPVQMKIAKSIIHRNLFENLSQEKGGSKFIPIKTPRKKAGVSLSVISPRGYMISLHTTYDDVVNFCSHYVLQIFVAVVADS